MNDKLEAVKKYFNGVKIEWGKITWPERQQVVAETFFVVVIIFVFTVFIYLVDIILNALLSKF